MVLSKIIFYLLQDEGEIVRFGCENSNPTKGSNVGPVQVLPVSLPGALQWIPQPPGSFPTPGALDPKQQGSYYEDMHRQPSACKKP